MIKHRGETVEIHEKGGINFRSWEDAMIVAFDQKYHQPELWIGTKGRVIAYHEQGYTQKEIGAFENIPQQKVSMILRGIGKNPKKA